MNPLLLMLLDVGLDLLDKKLRSLTGLEIVVVFTLIVMFMSAITRTIKKIREWEFRAVLD